MNPFKTINTVVNWILAALFIVGVAKYILDTVLITFGLGFVYSALFQDLGVVARHPVLSAASLVVPLVLGLFIVGRERQRARVGLWSQKAATTNGVVLLASGLGMAVIGGFFALFSLGFGSGEKDAIATIMLWFHLLVAPLFYSGAAWLVEPLRRWTGSQSWSGGLEPATRVGCWWAAAGYWLASAFIIMSLVGVEMATHSLTSSQWLMGAVGALGLIKAIYLTARALTWAPVAETNLL